MIGVYEQPTRFNRVVNSCPEHSGYCGYDGKSHSLEKQCQELEDLMSDQVDRLAGAIQLYSISTTPETKEAAIRAQKAIENEMRRASTMYNRINCSYNGFSQTELDRIQALIDNKKKQEAETEAEIDELYAAINTLAQAAGSGFKQTPDFIRLNTKLARAQAARIRIKEELKALREEYQKAVQEKARIEKEREDLIAKATAERIATGMEKDDARKIAEQELDLQEQEAKERIETMREQQKVDAETEKAKRIRNYLIYGSLAIVILVGAIVLYKKYAK